MNCKKEHFVTQESHLISGVLLAEVFPELVESIFLHFELRDRVELTIQLPYIVIPINAIPGDKNQFSIAVYTKTRNHEELIDYPVKFDRQLFAVPFHGGTVYIAANEIDNIDCLYFENLSHILDVLFNIDFDGKNIKIFDERYRKIPLDLLENKINGTHSK